MQAKGKATKPVSLGNPPVGEQPPSLKNKKYETEAALFPPWKRMNILMALPLKHFHVQHAGTYL